MDSEIGDRYPAEEKKGGEDKGVWLPSTPGSREIGLIQSEIRH